MGNVIELSSGHAFAAGSVKAVSPLRIWSLGKAVFTVHGVGFVVEITSNPDWDESDDDDGGEVISRCWNKEEARMTALREEAINRLLMSNLP